MPPTTRLLSVRGGLCRIWSWARTGEVLLEYRLAPSPRSVTTLRRARAFCAPHSHRFSRFERWRLRCNGVLLALAAPLLGGLARNQHAGAEAHQTRACAVFH